MEINTILSAKQWEVKNLLRRYKIVGPPTIETIQQAHTQKGDRFMIDLLKVISPQSNFTNLGTIVYPGSMLSNNIQAAQNQTAPKSKFWAFWDNLLGRVASTGVAIGQFKAEINAPDQYTQAAMLQQQQRNRLIFGAAAILMVIIVLTLIFRKQ